MLNYYVDMPIYSSDDNGGYIVDNFEKKVIKLRYFLPGGNPLIQTDEENSHQSVFLDEAIHKLTYERIKTRENYVNNFQNGVRIVFTCIYGTLFPDEPISKIIDAMNRFIKKLGQLDVLEEIALGALNIGGRNLEEVIMDILTESLNEAGLNNFAPSELKQFVVALTELLLEFAVTHPELTITLCSNIRGLGAAHFPELCLAWLMSEERWSEEDGSATTGDGGYRIIRINCPVDVEVYNSEGEMTGAIYNDTPLDIEDGVVTTFTRNEEKIVYLPNRAEYQISLIATDTGEMNYGISEYSTSRGMTTRLINYFSIAIQEGDVFHAYVPACMEINPRTATALEYTLTGPDMQLIPASSELKNDDAANAYCIVTAESEDIQKGVVRGNETYQLGAFATVEAMPAEKYTFMGWYQNGNMVSKDLEYRFRVTEDISLIAKFDNDTDENNGQTSNPNPEPDEENKNNDKAGGSDTSESLSGTWVYSELGWWYHYSNGTWPSGGWYLLPYDNRQEWYYFDEQGYMQTGWIEDCGKKYFLNPVLDGTKGRNLLLSNCSIRRYDDWQEAIL